MRNEEGVSTNDDGAQNEPEGALKRVAIVGGSVAFTALVAWLAFMLGAWGFDTRRFGQHQGRLEKLRSLKPRLSQVVQAFQDEGSPLIAAPHTPAELQRVAQERAGPKAAEVVAKGTRWAHMRVFLAGDMVYFIFFDEAGVMRDFTLVSR